MPELARSLWEAAGHAGGGLALALIVVLAAALAVLTLLFAAAAAVVLARFALLAQRPTSAIGAGALWTVAVVVIGLDLATGGLFQDPAGVREVWHQVVPAAVLAVLAATALCAAALRWLSPRIAATVALLSAALGGALWLGATGHGLLAWIPAVLLFAIALWARRRGARGATFLLAGTALVAAPFLEALHVGWRAPLALVGQGLAGGLLGLVLLGLVPLAIAGLIDARGRAEWFIAVRYLVAKRRQTFISVITGICVAGVAAGVWLIITVLSVMNGFERTWREEIIGNRAHFTVTSMRGPFEDYRAVVERLNALPGVLAASPYLDAEGMVRGENGGIAGVRIHGVDPNRIQGVTDLAEDLLVGSIAALNDTDLDADPGILVGSRLAAAMGLGEGSPLVVISPFGGPPTPFGSAPRLVRFRVVGIFETSFFQYDEVFTYVNLAAAQAFRRIGDVADGVEVRSDDFYRSGQLAASAALELGDPFYVTDWKEFFPAFFQALKTERVMMFVLLTMIMVVAAFAIVVTLVMMIMEKASDIAILKAMGAEDALVERIFAIEGALIGALGTVLGVLAGLAVTARLGWIQRRVEQVTGIDALPPSVYQGISELPAELDVAQIGLVVTIAMALALGGTWIPSRQAARVEPAEALRYE